MEQFLTGANAMAFTVAGLFFLRFWRTTHDRLFLTFALAFWVLGIARVGLVLFRGATEYHIAFYLLRLAAYLLIAYAILEKNWQTKGTSTAGLE
jgi:hypothetical protein